MKGRKGYPRWELPMASFPTNVVIESIKSMGPAQLRLKFFFQENYGSNLPFVGQVGESGRLNAGHSNKMEGLFSLLDSLQKWLFWLWTPNLHEVWLDSSPLTLKLLTFIPNLSPMNHASSKHFCFLCRIPSQLFPPHLVRDPIEADRPCLWMVTLH